jgi:D-alanine--poly(phosphoribitol) ligase subunit 1
MLIEKINSWSDICPQRIAHRQRDQTLTYAQLKTSSDDLASWLHQQGEYRGIQRCTPVIVYGHKESEMLICFIGCVKAGFPYIPIDTSVPSERVRQIIKASGAQIVLSPRRVPEENYQPEILVVEGLSVDQEGTLHILKSGNVVSIIDSEHHPLPLAKWQIQEDEVYYIIYTSGSTGIPKGVQITLGALENFLNWVNPTYGPKETAETFLNQAPFSFDLSVMDLYMSLSTGGTLFSLDKDQMANPKELFAAFAETPLTYWVSTPSFAEVCLMDRSFTEDLLPYLKSFLFCGEVLTHDCALKLNERFPQALVINMYGPTEATVATTSLTVSLEILAQFNPLPIGQAKPDTYVMVCDSEILSNLMEETGGVLLSSPHPLPEESVAS